MELDYKLIHERTIKELMRKTDESIMFETLAFQLEEEKKKVENELTKVKTELEKINEENERLKKETEQLIKEPKVEIQNK